MTVAVINELVREFVEPHLPDGIEGRFYTSIDEMLDLAPEAEIGWFDVNEIPPMIDAVERAGKLRWLNSMYAGLDFLPLDLLQQRGVTITNGTGINAIAISEYVLMLMLTHAKGYREVVRAQDRCEWLFDSPGKRELAGSRALLLGYGAIGQEVAKRLAGFGVQTTIVRRSASDDANVIGPDEWRVRLGEFDWIILALPATPETEGMIGASELSAMKREAVLVNIARGSLIDQAALVTALEDRTIEAALLDVTEPEPLPKDHLLWQLENAHVTMHLSGRAQDKMYVRSAERFVDNLQRFIAGEPMSPIFDPGRGY
ncbi:D-2-hydroxyacid dehydrogenase [Erythrobacter alti]|uniref:D-2-hydroxyacid dehydrogenase n=1 Tax=Erythrobacter alti TaxID=1896145 RepID=UPI0030F44FA5